MKAYIRHIYILPALLMACFAACTPIAEEPEPTPSEQDSIPKQDTVVVDNETPDQKRNPQYLYDPYALPDVKITISEKDWNQFLRNYDQNEKNTLYVPASWEYTKDGVTYRRDSVGLRIRGNTSRRRPEGQSGELHRRTGADWHHAHFGVCFTEYESGERFFGSDRVQLKWFNNDPTYVRELFCYNLMHRFGVWSAPYACYCRLTIHVEGDSKPAYFGVYELAENPRKGWLNDRMKDGYIPDKEGFIWKCGWASAGASLSDWNTNLMGVSDENTNYAYDLKTHKEHLQEAQQELSAFIHDMYMLASGSDALKAWLEEHVDVDLFLRAMAVDVCVGQWDGYWGNMNNYYIYFDSNHRFYYIPFDYDNTLGTGQEYFHNPGTQDPLNWNSRGTDRILCRKVFSIKEYENRFKEYMKELVRSEDLMETNAAIARILQWQKMINPYVNNDTGEDCTIYDYPAGWSYYLNYRILTGGIGNGLTSETNFFKTKTNSINKL